MLAFVAEQERLSLNSGKKAGIAAARAKGKHLGRTRIEIPEGFGVVYGEWRKKRLVHNQP